MYVTYRVVCIQNEGLYHDNFGWLHQESKRFCGDELHESNTREASDTYGGKTSECEALVGKRERKG
jgi:hypothetical protein